MRCEIIIADHTPRQDTTVHEQKEDMQLILLRAADSIVRRMLIFLAVITALYFASGAADLYSFLHHNAGSEYHDFAELMAVNPDTAAWIRMDGTRIDHPVVQGIDNFEYLSKDFNGLDYAGGTIFLDADCRKDMGETYILIHGHNMAGGAMFGDLTKYTDENFFNEHTTGELLTPAGEYDLCTAGVSIEDAYHSEVYDISTGRDAGITAASKYRSLSGHCILTRMVDFGKDDKLVALSTCAGDMSENRTVLFCRARLREQERSLRQDEQEAQ
ncbi:MAG: class B sortase [Clostridiales bacterium]|nr:class B sortase [Clostridiales bacterium]